MTRKFLYLSALALTVALISYLAYQDSVIREKFEGRRWALPARVYAMPVELYAEAPISADQLVWMLDQLKYRNDAGLTSQGSYSRRGNEIQLRTREFLFPDKSEPSSKVRVQFDGGRVRALESLDSAESPPLVRLDPVQIGSFYPALKEDRILVKLEEVPKSLIDALLAVEDRDFYEHFGLSAKGILRATWQNVKAGGFVQGGSTLTQQLVKNFFLSSERTLGRKISEAFMALILEARYSKAAILEAYLNEIYLGQDGTRAIHGFGLASQYYFSRALNELELPHVALLVALVRGPTYYDPHKHPERARERRDRVLDAMVEQRFITSAEADAARQRPLDVIRNPHQAISRYPAFLDLIRRQLQEQYRPEDLTSEGLRIFTTLNVFAQEHLESAITKTLARLDHSTRPDGRLETAAVFTRRSNGEIAALAGSRDAESSGFNRALDSVRQIGSLYKPVVYLTALEQPGGYTVATPLLDEPIKVDGGGKPWTPKNYDGKEHGQVPLHTALAHSYNLATVRLGLGLGIERTAETLRKLGVNREVETYPSLLLGAANLSPIEVATLYQTLASDGFVTPLRGIQAVLSQDGRTLQRFGLELRQAVDPGAVYLLNTILQEVMSEGTGRSVYTYLPEDFHVAGKTGTTNDMRDSWFAGFSGDYTGVVWVGRDDNRPAGLTGARGALQIWGATMQKLAKEPLDLIPPDDIVVLRVDRHTGLRADEGCADTQELPFVKGSEPAAWAPCAEGGETGGDSWFRQLF
ncbi:MULTISPECIES: penicillin-binding protein 1B [Methylococcus]|uniref:Penicillin-binding protein 1B n=1 Tax=Methylococcus capsulatus TaxID=414 RepID=A0ABZ2F2A6_METCP|nr:MULTISPECIES: penicillin-binding protein 1B [Methylococcus]MDF9391799.1 penicillin-binding protein 1B [Methylococcus capsulatus]